MRVASKARDEKIKPTIEHFGILTACRMFLLVLETVEVFATYSWTFSTVLLTSEGIA